MIISQVKLMNYRNFKNITINLKEKTLIIGSNDVGKTNLVTALRFIFDRTIFESQLNILESDFFINKDSGIQEDNFSIIVKISNITEEWMISECGGYITENEPRELIIKFNAKKEDLSYSIYIGPSEELLEKTKRYDIQRYLYLRFIKSKRDLFEFIKKRKTYFTQGNQKIIR